MDGAKLRFVPETAASTEVTADPATIEESLPADRGTPALLRLAHHDPARDYQVGIQQASHANGRGAEDVALSAVVGADVARGLAETLIERRSRGRHRLSCRAGWATAWVRPGSIVHVPGHRGIWRVIERSIEREGVRLSLARVGRSGATPIASDAGRPTLAPDRLHGPTRIHVLDVPSPDGAVLTAPRLLVAAAGTQPGWRRAELLVRQGDAAWASIGATAPSAAMGTSVTAPDAVSSALLDHRSSMVINMLHADMALEHASQERLLAGANLAALGHEVLQFGTADQIGPARWRLSMLLRGGRGTEWAMNGHAPGEAFTLIEPEAVREVVLPTSAIGTPIGVMAAGVGDATPVMANVSAALASVRPLSPVHLAASLRSDGGLSIAWVRRSRSGFDWIDGADAPLGEAEERYRVSVDRPGGAVWSAEAMSPALIYPSELADADRASGGTLTVRVVQIGQGCVSPPAVIEFWI